MAEGEESSEVFVVWWIERVVSGGAEKSQVKRDGVGF